MQDQSRTALLQLLTLFVVFLGGGASGVGLASFVAPDSSMIATISGLMLPGSLFLGFVAWLGLAILHLPMAIFRWATGRVKTLDTDEPFIPPGSFAFVPVSLGLGFLVGSFAGLAPGGWSLFTSAFLYGIVGLSYGSVLWRLALAGLLPFPQE